MVNNPVKIVHDKLYLTNYTFVLTFPQVRCKQGFVKCFYNGSLTLFQVNSLFRITLPGTFWPDFRKKKKDLL